MCEHEWEYSDAEDTRLKTKVCKKCGETVRIVKEYQSDDLEDYYMLGEGL